MKPMAINSYQRNKAGGEIYEENINSISASWRKIVAGGSWRNKLSNRKNLAKAAKAQWRNQLKAWRK